jgi:hypothetical protein
MKKKDKKYVIYIILGIIAYIAFTIIQYSLIDNKGAHISYLIILFLVSLIIGFFIQKIQSRQEFEENLKSKAYGAIRRLSDIEILVKRGLLRNKREGDAELIFLNIGDSIKSAKYDWADVIEDDLKTIQDIENKKRELLSIFSAIGADAQEKINRIDQLEKDISTLGKLLPPALQEVTEVNPIDTDYFFACQEMLNNEVTAKKALELQIEVLDPILITVLEQNKPLFFFYSRDGKKTRLFLTLGLETEQIIGRILNRYKKFGINDDYYYQVVCEAIDLNQSYGLFAVEEYSVSPHHARSEEIKWVNIPINKVRLGVG